MGEGIKIGTERGQKVMIRKVQRQVDRFRKR